MDLSIHVLIKNKKQTEWCKNCKNRFEMNYLLETSTKHTNCVFNKKIYSQVNGIAMGSPLGPLFADIYVNYLENKLMSRLRGIGVLFWTRFVDDTFVIINNKANVNKMLDMLNSFDNNVVFTCEEEKDNSLSFLDIQITRIPISNTTNCSKIFTTSIHRKHTYTGLITKWHSFVPRSYKISTISSMIYRAIKICSTYELMHDEFTFIENICIENGYPEPVVKSLIRKTLRRYFEKSKETKTYKSVTKTKNVMDNP